jgi:hypothetical protein
MRTATRTKNEISLQDRIIAISKPQKDCFGNVIPSVSQEIINEWVEKMVNWFRLGEECDKAYRARQRGEKNQLSKEQYDTLHAKVNALQDEITEMKHRVYRETGFHLNWAV